MHKKIVLAFLVQCTLCLAIRVPVDWNDDSEVKDKQFVVNENKETTPQPPIYNEYFKYTANKPQFAVDIAAAHGVQSPEDHYKPYPVRPHTGLTKPVLGQHHILNVEKNTYEPYQKFVQNSGGLNYVTPVSTSFEVYHPYKSEQPALQEIYKDPVLDKIRNDLRDSKHRLQKYENDAGEADISKEDYLESPEQTERKKFPHRNIPARYEIHRPQRRPAYYRVPVRSNYREQELNHKLRHPWNQNFAKVTPYHYHPVKNHLHRLRQHHALKFDDERNEYPQLTVPEKYGEQPAGYDIYEKGKEKYVQLRNNVDESINKVVQKNRPNNDYKLELQNGYGSDETNYGQDEEEFVPIKNYAQVRKTETTKHLPRTAALRDAESLEEIQNAPRLREAIKSKKAQIVYSEEGYEDAAYDHAGEQKHASDHEGHGGYLKENEISGGKYKTPSLSTSYGDATGSEFRDQLLHGEKWKDIKKENQDETESNDYSEDDEEDDHLSDVIVDDLNIENDSDRNKRNSEILDKKMPSENISSNNEAENDDDSSENTSEHGVIKRETTFKLPEFDFNSTLPSEEEIVKLSKVDAEPLKLKIEDNTANVKYPYYFQNTKTLNKNSPLRYAEDIALIPKKSNGGTEFYDSRSKLECSEVEDTVDAVPEKFKKDGHPDDSDDDSDDNSNTKNSDKKKFDTLKNKQRLNGLGDKIDCFKIKYFGENPLDSPFFKEEIIENPEPITKPNLKIFETKKTTEKPTPKLFYYDADIFSVLDKIQNRNKLKPPANSETSVYNITLNNNNTLPTIQSDLFTHLLNETNNRLKEKSSLLENVFGSNKKNVTIENILGSTVTSDVSNITYKHFQNKEDITKSPPTIRRKRAAPFTYEPYKIIRDSQIQDSKKTTTTSNISPLIKQLQSSRVIDKVTSNFDKDHNIKKNAKVYKDIGKVDRKKSPNEQSNDSSSATFVDVNPDKRRGEPRYELRPANHKTTYSPVENKRAISVAEYKTQASNSNDTETNVQKIQSTTQAKPKQPRSPKTASRPYFDVSKYLPQTIESQNIAASNAVRKVIRTITPEVSTDKVLLQKSEDRADEDEEYDEYEDDDEDEEEEVITTTTTTTTTTTRKPTTRKRTRGTTTIKPIPIENETELPKLHLTTRFRNPSSTTKTKIHHEVIKDPIESDSPKYTEKKRKSTKSMLVTDTKTYGDDDDDMTRKEVDALLQVKQDMNDYMPLYEKENNKHSINKKKYDDVDDNDDEDENEDDGEDDEDGDDDDDDDDELDEEDDEDENEDNDDSNHHKNKINLEVTTSEPTKRTLARTTVAPATTTESRSARIELKPLILKKKFEVHEESPVNKSSPHITQFKQDIKEIEIIKEMQPKPKSRKKIHKNLEALDLYRDDNLAEEINKLGDVEVFKENLNVKSGPKHGGNYRSITPEDLQKEMVASKQRDSRNKGDVETSSTQARKHIKLDDEHTSKHQGNIASTNSQSSPINDAKNAKLIELSDTEEVSPKIMHGGNLKYSRNKGSRQDNRNAKFIELAEDEEEETSKMHGGNFKSYGNRNAGRQMHGGNYKSAKIVHPDETNDKPTSRSKTRDARTNAAVLLNSYARVVPILTTTPAYILDPSKRMYYYVDA